MLIIIIIAIIGVVAISGCTSDNTNSSGDTNTQSLPTFTVSNETFQIPQGYSIKENGTGYAILIKDGKKIAIFDSNEWRTPPGLEGTTSVILGSKKVNDKYFMYLVDDRIDNYNELIDIIYGLHK